MRKILFSLAAIATAQMTSAQLVVDFESLTLPKADTFYVNYSDPGNDVGFGVGDVYLPCYYDTAWGGMWSNGFAYSNMTDSQTAGYTNMYSAITAKGYANSDNYVVYWDGYSSKAKITFVNDTARVTGFYATNSTYAYISMRDGDFAAKKFGDTTGTGSGLPQGSYPDWFKLTIKGYVSGTMLNDSVEFYLADFRFNDNDSDYIVRDWQWVDLTPLGNNIDSVEFYLNSSDYGSFGMNTPAYFCMDNVTRVALPTTSVKTVSTFAAKIYPNPALAELNVETPDNAVKTITVTDMTGKVLETYHINDKLTKIATAHLPSGMYLLQLSNGKQTAAQRFIKQ